jgi:hypothetical protein
MGKNKCLVLWFSIIDHSKHVGHEKSGNVQVAQPKSDETLDNKTIFRPEEQQQ